VLGALTKACAGPEQAACFRERLSTKICGPRNAVGGASSRDRTTRLVAWARPRLQSRHRSRLAASSGPPWRVRGCPAGRCQRGGALHVCGSARPAARQVCGRAQDFLAPRCGETTGFRSHGAWHRPCSQSRHERAAKATVLPVRQPPLRRRARAIPPATAGGLPARHHICGRARERRRSKPPCRDRRHRRLLSAPLSVVDPNEFKSGRKSQRTYSSAPASEEECVAERACRVRLAGAG
jgi:hypothetical protein